MSDTEYPLSEINEMEIGRTITLNDVLLHDGYVGNVVGRLDGFVLFGGNKCMVFMCGQKFTKNQDSTYIVHRSEGPL